MRTAEALRVVPLRERGFDPGPVGRDFRFPLAARRIFRMPEKISISEWAEKNKRHVAMSSQSGPWKNENSPYLAGIMDAFGFPSVRELVLCAPPQTGKTEVIFNSLAYFVDQDPGPAMIVMQTDTDARDMSRDRIRPMFRETVKLAEYMSPLDDDTSALAIRLLHMPLYLAWGTSVSRLASKPIKYLFFDEEDKYPLSFTRETSPIRLGKKRTRRFPKYKCLRSCSPTTETGSIWGALNNCPVVFKYFVRCPSCGFHQVMRFDRVRVPENERDPKKIKSQKLAWYECEHCNARWNDYDRDRAALHGKWMTDEGVDPSAYLEAHQPDLVGFHYSALISTFVSLSETMSVWFAAQGDKNLLRDFFNGYMAEPWVDYHVERSEDHILALRDDRPRGLVPGNGVVSCLLATVDTQVRDFRYEVRAFGFGMKAESWQIREGSAPTFDALEEILWGEKSEYRDAGGNDYFVLLTLIDAMGDKTSAVYDFCRMHRGRCLPIQGVRTLPQPFSYTDLDYYPNTKKKIPGGLRLVRLNTTFYKNALSDRLEINPHDPGAWHFHSEFTAAWAREMTVEYKDDDGFWLCPPGKPNHAWDLAAYQLLAADVAGVRFWVRPGSKPAQPKPKPKKERVKRW